MAGSDGPGCDPFLYLSHSKQRSENVLPSAKREGIYTCVRLESAPASDARIFCFHTVLTGSEIRRKFLDFFVQKGHKEVHSSSLVPANDPTLLFTNAGMNQFKDVFLGLEKRDYSRATTSQKCVRAGGKHNDLENVGFTRRHHTFFEMLGNFSFCDYFKKDAIAYAWELVTSPDWYGIPKDRLYVTIFEGDAEVPRDDEAERLWMDVGVPKERIFTYGRKDNFWQMGETGPCGPCSEIFYDMGLEAAEEPGVDRPFGQDDARYVEIWNLVFMQFDRSAETDAKGNVLGYKLTPLPKPSIDTGMGLERTAAVLQGVVSNFETDLFTPLIQKAAELTHVKNDIGNASLRIIADHARASTFLINDGVNPSNEGRGYVLRKILRRGIRHGRLLGQEKPFMRDMVYAVRDEMQNAYPELKESADRVAKVIEAEENQLDRVLKAGLTKLDELIASAAEAKFDEVLGDLKGAKASNRQAMLDAGLVREANTFQQVLPGDQAFHLYETYGLPLDFMVDAARDAGIAFDHEGFERAKESEQARARASWKGGAQKSASPAFRDLPKTIFEGYKRLNSTNAEVLAIVKGGLGVPAASAGDEVEVVLDHTSFYGDSGRQV